MSGGATETRGGPLAGVRVLDCADESAALASRILADLGADVLLVEPPEGSRTRRLGPLLEGVPATLVAESSLRHQYLNANKRSVVLDLESKDGRAHLAGLVAASDVLIETAAPLPGFAKAFLGVDDAALRALRPALVRASVTPFGLEAAWRDRCANDLVAGAAGGLLWVSGESDGVPVQGAGRPSYVMASLAAATGVMVALAAREREGLTAGLHLDISLQEATCMAVVQTANASWWTWREIVPRRPGLSVALRCADGGWVSFVTRPDRFRQFLRWVNEAGIENELVPDDWPHARIGAPLAGNPVIRAVGELLRRLPRDEFLAGAWRADQVALPVTDFPTMEKHEHFAVNRQFFDVEHEPLGRALGFVRSPVDAIDPERPIRRAPLLGEHSDEVLRGLPASSLRTGLEPSPTSAPDPRRALEGVRVVDLCWVLAGPLGTRILSNFGAEVIRVESSRRLDGMRNQLGPDGSVDHDLSGLFNLANPGKKSVSLDLAQPRAREILLQLVARSDVVTCNFRPGALERMGIGFETLRGARPDVVLLTMPGTHSQGPWSSYSTLGNTVMSGSGFNELMGFPGQRPRGIGVAWPDFTSPYLLATQVMAALRERDRTGRGRHVDLSQLSATIGLLGVEWMHYKATGRQQPRSANRDPDYCPHGVYPARGEDCWCAIAVEGDEQWRALCERIGRPELVADPALATHAARKSHEDRIDELVSTWTSQRDRWELAEELQAAGIAAAPVEHLRDTFERDPQLRDHYQRVRHPSAPDTDIPIDRDAIRFVGVHHQLERAPVLGEHNEEILCGLLGLSVPELDQLVLDGVVV